MKYAVLLTCLIALFCLFSCKKEVKTNLPEHQPILVVNCMFKAGAPFDVMVTRSQKTTDTLFLLNQPALVIISSPTQTDTLINDSSAYYHSYHLIAQENTPYQLKIIASGFPVVFAYDTIPSSTEMILSDFQTNTHQDEYGDMYSSFNWSIRDPSFIKNYYELFVQEHRIRDSNIYYPDISAYIPSCLNSSHPFITNEDDQNYSCDQLLLADKMFNGTDIIIPVNYDYDIDYFLHNDFYFIRKRTTSMAYYRYLKSWIRFYENRYSDIWSESGNPIAIYSNIKNGLGIFAGFTEQTDTIRY